jgi:hypothetical protein
VNNLKYGVCSPDADTYTDPYQDHAFLTKETDEESQKETNKKLRESARFYSKL